MFVHIITQEIERIQGNKENNYSMGMTDEEINAFLAQANDAIVGVNRANGAPQLIVVWYVWDGKAFYFSTTNDSAKYLNIQRDPSISLLVNDPAHRKYVTAYGRAIIEQNSEERVRSIIERYTSAEQAEPFIQRVLSDPKRIIVVLHPEKILTN